MKLLKIIAVAAIAFGLSACAGNMKQDFYFNHTDFTQNNAASTFDIVVNDLRDDKAIDMIYKSDLATSVKEVVSKELINRGLFKDSNDEQGKKDYSIAIELDKLLWRVDNYNQMLAKTFAASFLTGGIGGLAYGSTKTDVFGEASLNVSVKNLSSGKVIHQGNYKGESNINTIKLKMDTPVTKAQMAGLALEDAVKKLADDLAGKVN